MRLDTLGLAEILVTKFRWFTQVLGQEYISIPTSITVYGEQKKTFLDIMNNYFSGI